MLCLYCGTKVTVVKGNRFYGKSYRWRTACTNCEACGPVVLSKKEAIKIHMEAQEKISKQENDHESNV